MQELNDSKRLKLPEINGIFSEDTKNFVEDMKHGSNNILVQNDVFSLKTQFFVFRWLCVSGH